jgi:hypothetical protein
MPPDYRMPAYCPLPRMWCFSLIRTLPTELHPNKRSGGIRSRRSLTYAAKLLSRLLLLRIPDATRFAQQFGRTAMVAGSSICVGSPCCSRERRASSAPALRIRVRSSVLSGAHGGRRVSRRRTLGALTSSVPGLDTSRSVVGYHLPGTTRRVVITSCLLLSNSYGQLA